MQKRYGKTRLLLIIIIIIIIITITIIIRSSVYCFDMTVTTATLEVILLDLSELLTGVRALPHGTDWMKFVGNGNRKREGEGEERVTFHDMIDILTSLNFISL